MVVTNLIRATHESDPRIGDIDMADPTENDQENNTPTGEADIRKVVENANAEDENLDDDAGDSNEDDDEELENDGEGDESKDDDEEESDDDDDEDNPDDDKKDKSQKSDRKYKQYAGDGTDTSYIQNLEEAHKNSTTEAISLKQQLNQVNGRVDAIMKAAAKDPQLAEGLNKAIKDIGDGGDDGASDPTAATDNPFVRSLQAEWSEKSEKEIGDFLGEHPEAVADPEVSKDLKKWINIFSSQYYKDTNKLMSGGEAIKKAWKHLDLDTKFGKQNLAKGAKKTVTPPRSRGSKKKALSQKENFTADQLAMAKAMGKDQAWLEKNAK